MLKEEITVENILQLGNTRLGNGNPFATLQEMLRLDIVIALEGTHRERLPYYIFLGVNGLCFFVTIIALAIRLRKREKWLYRLQETPTGNLIVPNAIMTYLFWNIFYDLFIIPYILLGCYRLGGNLQNFIWWKVSAVVPLFLGLWNVTYAFTLSTHLTTLSQGRSIIPFKVSALLANSVFIVPQVVFIVALLVTTALSSNRWNGGWHKYVQLSNILTQQSFRGAESLDLSVPEAAALIRSAIPEVDELLAKIADKIWRFQAFFQVCSTMMLFCAVVIAFSCVFQTILIKKELRSPVHSTSTGDGVNWSPGPKSPVTPSTSDFSKNTPTQILSPSSFSFPNSPAPSISSRFALLAKPRPVQTLKDRMMVLHLISFLIFCSGILYFAACHVSNHDSRHTKIFEIRPSRSYHLGLMMFGYTSINLSVLGVIIWQTLFSVAPTAHTSTSKSNTWSESQSPRTLNIDIKLDTYVHADAKTHA